MKGQKANADYFDVAPNVWGMKDIFVNIYMIKNSNSDKWVLIDAGLKTSASKIKKMAASLFGENSRPSAIILTHGHFDHTGSIRKLAEAWDVPVYAHYLELPYLTGISSYPPPDSCVGGGMMAWIAFIYPKKPIDISDLLKVLPPDNSVPGFSEWKYIHTPGHAPGHISLFREADKVLIAGDAFVTTKQESALAVMTQKKQVSGPPKYFTYDWEESEDSVGKLVTLAPEVAATGHGKPMYGDELRAELNNLQNNFKELAVPAKGRYVDEPAVADANGVLYIPPLPVEDNKKKWAIAGAVIASSVLLIALTGNKRKHKVWG
jgi:glyoxylase-like metal-dependent hydrolase (beta-lactamase superfamily II)